MEYKMYLLPLQPDLEGGHFYISKGVSSQLAHAFCKPRNVSRIHYQSHGDSGAAEAATKEGFYEYTFYLIFSMLNVYVRTQLKVGDTPLHALALIDARGYAKPYLTDDRRVVKAGIRFDADKHTVDKWVVDTGNAGS